MDDRKTVSIYHLIIVAIVLLIVFAFIVQLNRVRVPPGSAVNPPAETTTAPAGGVERPYNMPPKVTVNPFPSDEAVRKNIEEQAKAQEIVKEKIAERDKRAAIVRTKIIAIQDELLADEVKNAQQAATASQKTISKKTISTAKYVKKELSKETKEKVLSGGYHFGH